MIEKGPFFEEVEPGSEIAPLVKKITQLQMVMYAAATWDFARGHYEREFARSQGFPEAYVDGQMLGAFLAQLVTGWTGIGGTLKRLGVRYRIMVFPGETVTCKGRVTEKYIRDGEGLVDCELWVENERGERVAEGTATAVLPRKIDINRVRNPGLPQAESGSEQ